MEITGGTAEEADAAGASPDVDAIIIPPFLVMSHEDLTERYLTEVRETVKEIAGELRALRSEVSELRRTVDGVVKMVRTPSGVLAGTVLDRIAAQVDRLHHEAFQAGGGFLGDASTERDADPGSATP